MMYLDPERERDLREVDRLLVEERTLRSRQADEVVDRELTEKTRRQQLFDKQIGVLEKQENDLNRLVERLIENKQLSTFQIVDGVVEKVLELLHERGVRDYDHTDFDKPPEKWVPYVTAKTKKPPEFIQDVYGEYRGLTRVDIRKIDPSLGAAYDKWVSGKKPLPPSFSLEDQASNADRKAPNAYQLHHYNYVKTLIADEARQKA